MSSAGPLRKLEFHWCIPVTGDGFYLGLPSWERQPSLDYAVAIAQAAEQCGFAHALFGMGFDNHPMEAWTFATAVLLRTSQLVAMIAVRPGFYSAPVFAKMVATLDRLCPGRISLNVVTGGRPDEQAMYGDRLDHSARYRRTLEFMQVTRRLWSSTEAWDFAGEFHQLQQSRLEYLPSRKSGPLFYFGGASEAAAAVGAAMSDVYLMWGEPLAHIEARIAAMRARIAAAARTAQVRFGLRINIVAAATEALAREQAQAMISKVSPAWLERGRRREFPNTRRESVGQGRQWELRGSADQDWYVEPLLWAGISIVRSGAGMALVGSYDQVAARLCEYRDLGVDSFVLSGYPHLEACTLVGREILPRVRELVLQRSRRAGC